jgi:glycosyltransferase involved in cell wall biosynthesis
VNVFDIDPITGKVRGRPNACRYCRDSEHIVEAVAIPNVHFYYQGVANDASGWNLASLASQLGVADNFHYNPNIRPTAGYDDKSLNIIYNCMDVFTCPTTAEGFGLPIMEAMSAGVPTLLPNYSAYTDWIGESGILVSGEKYIETSLNATRIQIHMDDWIDKALQMMDTTAFEGRPHRESTFWMSLAARKIAESYDIEKTVQKFDALFTKILANKPAAPKVNLTRI